jgi:hypothetical protein
MSLKPNDLTLSIAKTGLLLTNFQKLVFVEYGKRGWLNQSNFPDGLVIDEYDRIGDTIAFHQEEKVLAGMRIVRDSPLLFPHEKFLGLANLSPKEPGQNEHQKLVSRTSRFKMAEITRVVSQVSHKPLFYNITKSLYWYSIYFDIDLFLMVIDINFFRLGNAIGMPIYPIGESVFCEGSETIPAITIPSLYKDLLKEPWGRSYIEDQANLADGLCVRNPNSALSPLSTY